MTPEQRRDRLRQLDRREVLAAAKRLGSPMEADAWFDFADNPKRWFVDAVNLVAEWTALTLEGDANG